MERPRHIVARHAGRAIGGANDAICPLAQMVAVDRRRGVLSGAAGKIAPMTDLATLDWVSVLGNAQTAANFEVRIKNYLVKL